MTDADFDPEYKKMPMWDQLGKILDSQSNPFPRNWVETDDGDKIEGITPKDTMTIRTAMLMIEKTQERNVALHRIQKTDGFKRVLEMIRGKNGSV